MTAMLDASTTAALVAAVENYRMATGAGFLAVGHDQTLLGRWCDRVLHWDEVTSRALSGIGKLPQASGLREPSVVPPAT
jgi:peptide/nickel transport system ATP-binding protein